MAKPKLENGYTQIANEILEQLVKLHLSPNQWQVLLCIIRKTYGFHKKVDYIANKQLGEATGLGKTVVSRALHSLAEMNIITRQGKHIGFQKDWEQWGKLAEQLTREVSRTANQSKQFSQPKLAKRLQKVSSPDVAQKIKDTYTKNTIQKIRKKTTYFFGNILLFEEEYQKLVERFGEVGTKDKLETLSLYKWSRGKKYSSDYATVLSWAKKDEKEHPAQDRFTKYQRQKHSHLVCTTQADLEKLKEMREEKERQIASCQREEKRRLK